MSFRPVEREREATLLPVSIMSSGATARGALVALAIVALWLVIGWAVALP